MVKEVNNKPYEQIIDSLYRAKEKNINTFGKKSNFKLYIKNVAKVLLAKNLSFILC